MRHFFIQSNTMYGVKVMGVASGLNYIGAVPCNLDTLMPNIDSVKEFLVSLERPKSSVFLLTHIGGWINPDIEKIVQICNKFGVEIKFVFLDDNFFKFTESKIPQFLNKSSSIKILNSLKKNNNQKKEKIYISRQNCNFRNLLNERDVIIKLKKLDYKIVDLNNFEVEEQI